MEILRQFTYGFFSTLGFAILFQAPKKSLITNGIIGGIGWIVYKYLMLNGYSILFSAMVASIIIGSISAIISVFIKMPAITFFAPSIIPLVPGGGMYYTGTQFPGRLQYIVCALYVCFYIGHRRDV